MNSQQKREKVDRIDEALQRALPKTSIGEILNRQKQKVGKTDDALLHIFTQTKL